MLEYGADVDYAYLRGLEPISRLWPAILVTAMAQATSLEQRGLEILLDRDVGDHSLVADIMDALLYDGRDIDSSVTSTIAALRHRARELDERDVIRAAEHLKADKGTAPLAVLLICARYESAVLAMIPLAKRHPATATLLARRHGVGDKPTLELLKQVWSRKQDSNYRKEAAALAVSWGDGQARAALPEIERAYASWAKRMGRI